MTLDIFFALIAFIYLYLVSNKKKFQKIKIISVKTTQCIINFNTYTYFI